jgi:hypothetical protein
LNGILPEANGVLWEEDRGNRLTSSLDLEAAGAGLDSGNVIEGPLMARAVIAAETKLVVGELEDPRPRRTEPIPPPERLAIASDRSLSRGDPEPHWRSLGSASILANDAGEPLEPIGRGQHETFALRGDRHDLGASTPPEGRVACRAAVDSPAGLQGARSIADWACPEKVAYRHGLQLTDQ